MSVRNPLPCQVDNAETYLGTEQLRYFKDKLLLWRSELCARLKGCCAEAMNEGLPDWIDSASLRTQMELSLGDRERSLQSILQVDEALERIAAGSYGYCAISGEEIGIERLTAMPTARYCIETQNDIERRSRRFR